MMAAVLVAGALVGVLRPVGHTQEPQKAALVLIPWLRGLSVSMDIDGAIRTVLNDGLAGRLDYYTEYLEELFPAAAVVSASSSPRRGPKATGVLLPLDLSVSSPRVRSCRVLG